MDNLSSEIVESQKLRLDLYKWKIIVCAIVFGIGFGFTETQMQNSYLVLCVIPIVCAYIDMLCWHNLLRIWVIGSFRDKISETKSLFKGDKEIGYIVSYENYVAKCRKKRVFIFQTIATLFSSYIFSLLLIVIPIIDDRQSLNLIPQFENFIIWSGVSGIILTTIIYLYYEYQSYRIKQIKIDDPSAH